MSGSSNSEPGNAHRAISQSFCGTSYGGLRARRHGSERVRRKITVIHESEPDMSDMPDEASIRALHETLRPNDYQVPEQYLTAGLEDPRAHAQEVPSDDPGMPRMGISGPQEVSHGDHFTASTDSSVANGNELHRLVHAPEGVLPSDLVSCPAARSQGG